MSKYPQKFQKIDFDEKKCIGKAFQDFIWFLFPSDVLPDLLSIKHQAPLKFSQIVDFNNQRDSKATSKENKNHPPL